MTKEVNLLGMTMPLWGVVASGSVRDVHAIDRGFDPRLR